MSIESVTARYEAWLSKQTALIRADLAKKHTMMAESPAMMLRATYYRFLQQFPKKCPEIAGAQRLLGVGDLHVENFGTWRDAEGRLVWGVNDFDEAGRVPWTLDLVRLATSAVLGMELGATVICRAILRGYAASLARGGGPFVLAERNAWLREIAWDQLRDPERYWARLTASRPTRDVPPDVRRELLAHLPEGGGAPRFFRRRAGVGSRGHARFAVVADWRGGFIAREAKALAPGALVWLSPRLGRSGSPAELAARAVRCPDPIWNVKRGWVFRRLAPDCSKIDLAELRSQNMGEPLLEAMGWEAANMHLGSPAALPAVKRDLRSRKSTWLLDATREMERQTRQDWKEWRAAHRES